MGSRRGLITAGVGTLLIGLLVMLPARIVYRLVAPPDVRVSGISGTAWTGAAQELSVGDVYLRDIQWRFRPLQILTGKISYHLEGNPAPGFVETDLSVGMGGKISFTSLRAAIPIGRFRAPVFLRRWGGTANIQFEKIDIVDQFAVAADGTVEVRNLIIDALSTSSLGGFKVDFFTQSDGITASIEETDGVIDLAGSLQISSDRSYQFLGQVIETPKTPTDIRRQFEMLPPANARGQRELRLEGTL